MSKLFVQVILLVMLSVIIWFVGPSIHIKNWTFLDHPIISLVMIGGINFLWLICVFNKYGLFKKMRQGITFNFSTLFKSDHDKKSQKQNKIFKQEIKKLILGLTKGEILSGKKIKALYKLPWFLIVGPKNDGKSSIIENSGLNFPELTKNHPIMREAIQGLKWYVTEEAVFLEYSNSEMEEDNKISNQAWKEILTTLKNYKKDKPLNGILIPIDMIAFLKDSEIERNKKIDTIRHYIKDLYEQLGIYLPFYVIVTKCDQLSGFLEFFNQPTLSEQEQIIGFTFPLDSFKKGNIKKVFTEVYDTFCEQLNNKLLWLLNEERDKQRRNRLCFFPQQLILIKDIITESFEAILTPNKLYELVEFRGVYFTSASPQNNVYCDPLGSLIVKQFDMVPMTQIEPALNSPGLFLKKIYRDIIIPEANYFNDYFYDKKSKINFKYVTSAIMMLGLIVSFGFLMVGYNYNQTHAKLALQYLEETQINKCNENQIADLSNTLSVLGPFKNALNVYENDPQKWLLSYEIYQGHSIHHELKRAYLKKLQMVFLPFLYNRLQSQLILEKNQFATLFEIFKGYLSLGYPTQLPLKWLEKASTNDWLNDTSLSEEQKQALNVHLNYLLAHSFEPLELNQDIIHQTAIALLSNPLEHTIYNIICSESHVNSYLNLLEILNRGGSLFESQQLVRIPKLYTKEGFIELYSPKLLSITKDIENDLSLINPILNNKLKSKMDSDSVVSLSQKVNMLYIEDYFKNWQTNIDKLNIIPSHSLEEAITKVSLMHKKSSPFTVLLNVIHENLEIVSMIANKSHEPSSLHFLNALANPSIENTASAVNILKNVEALQTYLLKIKEEKHINLASYNATKLIMAGDTTNPITVLMNQAEHMPEPIRGWLETMTKSAWHVLMTNTHSYLSSLWQAEILTPFETLSIQYPIAANASEIITPEKFIHFFSKKGALSDFYEHYLAAYIDASTDHWKWKELYGSSMSSSKLTAHKLQEIYNFNNEITINDKNQLEFSLLLTPLNLSSNAASVILKIGEDNIIYRHGPQEKFSIKWPPNDNSEQVSINFRDFEDKRYTKVLRGPWSLFKLINMGSLKQIKPNHFSFNITVDGYSAEFLMDFPGKHKSLFSHINKLELPKQF